MDSNLTERQRLKIDHNVVAFAQTFGYLAIMRYSKAFYVYTSIDKLARNEYTYYSNNLDNINGWLYGCVQTKNGVVK